MSSESRLKCSVRSFGSGAACNRRTIWLCCLLRSGIVLSHPNEPQHWRRRPSVISSQILPIRCVSKRKWDDEWLGTIELRLLDIQKEDCASKYKPAPRYNNIDRGPSRLLLLLFQHDVETISWTTETEERLSLISWITSASLSIFSRWQSHPDTTILDLRSTESYCRATWSA